MKLFNFFSNARWLHSLLFITIIAVLTACTVQETPERNFSKNTNDAYKQFQDQVGYPEIINFQEAKFLKEVYELTDKSDLIRYAYFFNEREGKIGQYLGRCMGYGIPYSLQFTNPEKVVHLDRELGKDYSSLHIGKIPQPEPNMTYKPEGLSATWLMLENKKTGKFDVAYIEPAIIVLPFKREFLDN